MNFLKSWTTSPSRMATMLLAGFCIGVGVGDWWQGDLRSPDVLPYGSSVVVEGHIQGEVEQLLSSQRATLDQVRLNGQPIRSNVLVRLDLFPTLLPDQTVSLRCALKKPEPVNGFRYDRLLASRNTFATCGFPFLLSVSSPVRPTVTGLLLRLKTFLFRRLAWALPEPVAPFLSGLVFGGNTGLSPDLQNAFSVTGTSHVLAASGSNVSLLTALFLGWAMETRLGRRRAILLTAALLAAYVVMAGAVPAIVRAALMASVLLVGSWVHREADTTNLLLLTAAVMLAASPRILFDDVGFQLSFGATVALVLFSSRWEPAFSWIPAWGGLRSSFVTSLAATTLTLPIILWHFGTISLISPFANLVLLPFIPFLVLAGLVAFGAAVLHPALGAVIGLPAWAGASLFLQAEQWISSIPFALVSVSAAHAAAAASCLPILFLLWRSRRTPAC